MRELERLNVPIRSSHVSSREQKSLSTEQTDRYIVQSEGNVVAAKVYLLKSSLKEKKESMSQTFQNAFAPEKSKQACNKEDKCKQLKIMLFLSSGIGVISFSVPARLLRENTGEIL